MRSRDRGAPQTGDHGRPDLLDLFRRAVVLGEDQRAELVRRVRAISPTRADELERLLEGVGRPGPTLFEPGEWDTSESRESGSFPTSDSERSPLETFFLGIAKRELGMLEHDFTPGEVQKGLNVFLETLRGGDKEGRSSLEAALVASVEASSCAAGIEVDYEPPSVVVQMSESADALASAVAEETKEFDGRRLLLLTDKPEDDGHADDSADDARVVEIFEEIKDAPSQAWEDLLGVVRTSTPPAPRDAMRLVGRVLDDKYEIQAVLGKGGFGTVYRAWDRDLECPVAIKIVNERGGRSGRELTAFKQEARRLTRLHHPNIVDWKTLNESSYGLVYLVMEFLDGEELEETIRREGRLEPRRAAGIMLQILDALRHAHDLPDGSCLLHLDLKPKNVFLTRGPRGEERVKVFDFGIGRFSGEDTGGPSEAGIDEILASEDLEGTVQTKGGGGSSRVNACTPTYCSPEQAAHMLMDRSPPEVDARSDLYSLGVMSFRMLTGELPFEKPKDRRAMLRLHRDAVPSRIGSKGVAIPRGVARFVDRCLRKNPDERFVDTHAAYDELRKFVHPPVTSLVAKVILAMLVASALVIRFVIPGVELPVLAIDAQALAGNTLYFGPSALERSLEPLDLSRADLDQGEFTLLSGPRADARDLEADGWFVARDADRFLGISTQPRVASTVDMAVIAFDSDAGRRFTEPIRLSFLHPDQWDLSFFDVPGRDDRVLDPLGQALEIHVDGPGAELDGVRVSVDGTPYVPSPVPARSSEGRSAFALSLDDLSLESGEHLLRLEIRDLADNVLREELTLEVAGEPLTVLSCSLDGLRESAGYWYVPVGHRPELVVSLNRPAALEWRVVDAKPSEGRYSPARLHRVAVPLDESVQGNYSARVELSLDETELVLHAEGSTRGRANASIPFKVVDGVSFAVESNAEVWTEPTSGAEVHFFSSPVANFLVERGSDAPFRVLPTFVTEGGGVAPSVEKELEPFDAMGVTSSRLVIAFHEEGVSRLTLDGNLLDAAGAAIDGIGDSETLVLVHDVTKPRVGLDGWPAEGEVLRSLEGVESLDFRIEGEVFRGEPTPVDVSWSLRTDLLGEVAPGRRIAGLRGEAETVHLAEAALSTVAAGGPDGRYTLLVQARDVAGHLTRVERSWFVSTEGPRLQLVGPEADQAWIARDRSFRIVVEADDPNGVEGVRCTISDVAGDLEPLVVDLEPVGRRGREWEGTFAPDHRWSTRRVELEVSGVDAHGTETAAALVETRQLPAIESAVPDQVAVHYRGRGRTPMCRIRGNDAANYVFGGRGGMEEDPVFKIAETIGEYSTTNTDQSYKLVVDRGTLGDYYLDQYEVTVAQYLDFVQARTGFMAPENWSRVEPSAGRRDELEQRLSGLPPLQAVTGVAYDEAEAYATWVGKELPTYVHWEYAVRGAGYRVVAFAKERSRVALDDINVGDLSKGPWDVTRGRDRTPDTDVANLASNVSEWTRTPIGALDAPTALSVLGVSASAEDEKVIAVGGSYRRARFHFQAFRRAFRDERGPDLGFRCMLPASTIDDAYVVAGSDYTIETADR